MGKSRFFKAYFIASLIYAVWFGVLMYAVDPMFLDVMECNTLPGDYLCVQSGYTRPFTTFLYPFLSIVIFSLVHAGIMKWRKRRSVLTGTVFASLPLLGMALAQTFAVAIVSLQINRKNR